MFENQKRLFFKRVKAVRNEHLYNQVSIKFYHYNYEQVLLIFFT